MSRQFFLANIIGVVRQMAWNLFYRHQPANVILAMNYEELKFWNECHEAMAHADEIAYEEAKNA